MLKSLLKNTFRLLLALFCLFGVEQSKLNATNIYNRPYSLTENQVDGDRLKKTTYLLFGTGIATMGILYLMPSSFTNWEDDGESPFEKWKNNVSEGPVKDKDDLFLNYVTHPYSGAIYYMGARSAGANSWYSFWYSFALSTFFWEYGIEAFAEVPSIQDLIITPVAGAILGEGFYLAKRHILKNDNQLLGSRFLGRSAIWIMDPMTEVGNLMWDEERPMNDSLTFQMTPTFSSRSGLGYRFSLQFNF